MFNFSHVLRILDEQNVSAVTIFSFIHDSDCKYTGAQILHFLSVMPLGNHFLCYTARHNTLHMLHLVCTVVCTLHYITYIYFL